jgi:D-alanine--poly(phosphoribitol) ligase subunit 1
MLNNVVDSLIETSRKYPTQIALKIGNDSYTYNDLFCLASKISTILNDLGVHGKAIGIVGQKRLSTYAGILASLISGSYYVPINPKNNIEKNKIIIKDAAIKCFIGVKNDIEKIKLFDFDNISQNNFLVILPEDKLDSRNASIKDKVDVKNTEEKYFPRPACPNNLAYIMFTSGSTGKPKGVKVTYRNLNAWLCNMSKIFRQKSFISSQTYDFSFDLSVADLLLAWTSGGSLVTLPEEEMLLPHEFINREKIEFWSSVPTLLSFMNKMELLKENVFPTLKVSVFCGEPLTKELAELWKRAAPNSTIENYYGPTEATIWITRYSYDSNIGYKFHNNIIPIGKIFPDHRVEIVNKDGSLVKKKEIGQLIYSGAQITEGYLNDEVKTRLSFVKFDWDKFDSIWYMSGDLAFINDNDDIEFIGRIDTQIKINGRRLELGEIEFFLRKFKKLNDVVVVPKKENNTIVTLYAYTLNTIDENDRKKIYELSDSFIDKIFFPRKFISLKKFPLTTSGKIDRNALLKLTDEL